MPAAENGARTARPWEWLGAVVALLLVAAPGLFWGGQVIDEEAVGFLRKYWERPFLRAVYDVRGWDFFQGRELSYAIDYLDAQWVRLLVDRGILVFLPPSAVLASLAFVLTGATLARRALPDLPAPARWLGLSVLLSNFVFLSTMGVLYRATKPLVAPLLLALLLFVLAELRQPRSSPRAGFAWAFVLAVAMSALDRQGLFYVLALLVVLAAVWALRRRGLPLLLGVGAAVAVWYAYFRVVAPWLVHELNGYWPRSSFQRVRPQRMLNLQLWGDAASVLGDWTSVMFGRPGSRVLIALALAAISAWVWHERRRPRRLVVVVALGTLALLAQLTMVAIMVERHQPVTWISHRLWYYPLPYQALLVFGLLVLLERLSRRPGLAFALPAVLAGVVVLNVARWPEVARDLDSDPPYSDQLRRSALLVRSLRDGRADLLLDGDHRRFYFECLDTFRHFGERSQPQVGEADGVLVSQIERSRVVAWAERQSHLAVRAPQAGRYVIAGRARLRPGDGLQLLLGTSRPRLLGEVQRQQPGEGEELFRVAVELSPGVQDLQLLSRLDSVRVPGEPRRRHAGYVLQLPVWVWRDELP